MSEDKKFITAKVKEQDYSAWMPPRALDYLRSSEDLYVLGYTPIEPSDLEGVPEPVLLSMYLELLAATHSYLLAHQGDALRTSSEAPASHQSWLELLNRLKFERFQWLDQKARYGEKTAKAEPDWQKKIAEKAWKQLVARKPQPGRKLFQHRCRKLAAEEGRSHEELELFTDHYCREKLRQLKNRKTLARRRNFEKFRGNPD